MTARAGNRRFWLLSTLRAHTKAPYKTDLHRKTLMALNGPGTARTEHVLEEVREALPLGRVPHRAHLRCVWTYLALIFLSH